MFAICFARALKHRDSTHWANQPALIARTAQRTASILPPVIPPTPTHPTTTIAGNIYSSGHCQSKILAHIHTLSFIVKADKNLREKK